MAVGIKLRAGRASALMMTKQTGQGSFEDDFTAAGDSAVLWTTNPIVSVMRQKTEQNQFMMELEAQNTSSRHNVKGPKEGAVEAHVTPSSLEFMLRSNWGPLAAGTFSLKSQVEEYFTAGWVEDVAIGADQKLVRLRDLYFDVVEVGVASMGFSLLTGQYLASEVDENDLDALPGGIILPSSPMGSSSKNLFPGRNVTFIRDPDGMAQSVPFDSLILRLNQNRGSDYDQLKQRWNVFKRGKAMVDLTLVGQVSAETWELLSRSLTGTKQKYRLNMVNDETTPKTFRVDMFEMDFMVQPLGKVGQSYVKFIGRGRAHKTGPDFVAITLS